MKLVAIQVLRAVAALSVAFAHAQHDAEGLAGALGVAFRPLLVLPWTAGVDLFFVISGFIMVHASGGLYGRPGAARVFFARRLARIVPLYWAATTLYLATALVAPRVLNRDYLDPGFVLASYLFVPAARPDGLVQPLYALGWTLNYEMLFYVLFALALGLSRRASALVLVAVLATMSVAGWGLGPLPEPLAFWTSPMILEFALGIAIGVAEAEGVRLRLGLGARGAAGALGVAGLALAAAAPDALLASARPLAYGLPSALMVAAAALGRPAATAESGIARLGAMLGDASYALYLVHPFAIRGTRELLLRTGLAGLVGPWGFVLVSLALSGLAAVVVHRTIEHPLTRAARRGLGGDRPRSPVREPAPGPLG